MKKRVSSLLYFVLTVVIIMYASVLESYAQNNRCDSTLLTDSSITTYHGSHQLVLIWRKDGLTVYAEANALEQIKFSFHLSEDDYKKRIQRAADNEKDTGAFEFIDRVQRWSWRIIEQSKCSIFLNGKEIPTVRFWMIRKRDCSFYQRLYFTKDIYWDYRPTF